MTTTPKPINLDQALESSNQEDFHDDTTKLGDLAVVLNALQRAAVRSRNATRTYTKTVPNKVLQPIPSPPVYSTITIYPPIYSPATFVVKQQEPRPFEKVIEAPRGYDFYDEENTHIVRVLPEHSKVLLHGSGVIQCLDQGNFPHPASCKKFIYCAKIDNGEILGWEYTCPKDLSFDPIGGICNWSADLGCGE